jgi:hypothetical protein
VYVYGTNFMQASILEMLWACHLSNFILNEVWFVKLHRGIEFNFSDQNYVSFKLKIVGSWG